MTKRLPLLLTKGQAAQLVGVSAGTFGAWVSAGIMPGPLTGTGRWSRVQLERAAAGQSWVPPDAPAQGAAETEDPFDALWREHDERDKHGPLHSLNKRLERALRHLQTVDFTDGTDAPGASDKTFEALVDLGLAVRNRSGWSITAEGSAEVARFETYKNWKFPQVLAGCPEKRCSFAQGGAPVCN